MTHNRKLIFPLSILFAIVGLTAIVFLVRANPDQLLHQSARLMYEATDGHAIVSIEIDMEDNSNSGTIEAWGQRNVGPEGEPAFRVEVLETSKPEAAGVVAVSDGSQFWLWNPQKNTVYVGTAAEMEAAMQAHHADYVDGSPHPMDEFGDYAPAEDFEMPETPEEAVDKLLEYFTAELVGTEDVENTPAQKIRLIPIPEQMPDEVRANGGFVNVWLRSSDTAPLAVEYAEGAIGYAKMTVSQLELNQGIDTALFTFEIPAGAEVVNIADLEPPSPMSAEEAAAAVDFEMLTPDSLAISARLVDIVEMRGALVQQYRLPNDGRFTIAQGPENAAPMSIEESEAVTVRGTTGNLMTDEGGQRTLLSWSENGQTFWIGGDLSAKQALEIAESLQ